jgi:hypothetical protein
MTRMVDPGLTHPIGCLAATTRTSGLSGDRDLKLSQFVIHARVAITDRYHTRAVTNTRSGRAFATTSPHKPHRHDDRCRRNCSSARLITGMVAGNPLWLPSSPDAKTLRPMALAGYKK